MGTFAETANVDYRSSFVISISIYVYIYLHIYMLLFQMEKKEAHAIFINPLSLSFVRLFTKKQTEVTRLQTD